MLGQNFSRRGLRNPPLLASSGRRHAPGIRESNVDFLVALVGCDDAGIRAMIRDRAVDFVSFQGFAMRNQVSGYLHTVLEDASFRDLFPQTFLDEIAERHHREARKRELLDRELRRVADVFLENGPAFILLKGPQLAERYYGSAERRAYWDLDLLVRRRDLSEARTGLLDCGFTQRSSTLFGDRVSMAVAHALDYGRGEVGIDLHWMLTNHPAIRLDYARLWNRRRRWVADARSLDALSDDYSLTLNLLSSLKDIERGAFRLRSFVDLWMILKEVDAHIAWDDFFVERHQENVRRICTSILALFLQVFHAEATFPHLARALTRQAGVSRVARREVAIQLIAPTFVGLARRLWTARLYEISPVRHFAWWAVSLPVRINVHNPAKVERFKRGLRRWRQSKR
jgi:hypothetical protein